MRKDLFWMLPLWAVGTVVSAQTTAISGKVVDENGVELPGVNVSVKGTQVGTLTDVNGSFSLDNVPGGEKAVLLFSYVGYMTQEVKVGNERYLRVKLLENAEQLDEVVVLGYGS